MSNVKFSHTTKRPLILITPRWEPQAAMMRDAETPEKLAPNEGAASVFIDAIIAAGGMPFVAPLTHDEALMDELVDLADGFAIPGGADVNPMRWGDTSPYDPKLLCEPRDAFEIPMIQKILEADKPLFGTCRGAQVTNVALGGSLCMDVPSLKPREGMALWRHVKCMNDPIHPVEVKAGSMLRQIVGQDMIQVNSWHHCCVDRLGEGAELVAEATDGVPECFEVPSKRFCLCVQWHPEYTWRKLDTDFRLWQAFVSAAAGR